MHPFHLIKLNQRVLTIIILTPNLFGLFRDTNPCFVFKIVLQRIRRGKVDSGWFQLQDNRRVFG